MDPIQSSSLAILRNLNTVQSPWELKRADNRRAVWFSRSDQVRFLDFLLQKHHQSHFDSVPHRGPNLQNFCSPKSTIHYRTVRRRWRKLNSRKRCGKEATEVSSKADWKRRWLRLETQSKSSLSTRTKVAVGTCWSTLNLRFWMRHQINHRKRQRRRKSSTRCSSTHQIRRKDISSRDR